MLACPLISLLIRLQQGNFSTVTSFPLLFFVYPSLLRLRLADFVFPLRLSEIFSHLFFVSFKFCSLVLSCGLHSCSYLLRDSKLISVPDFVDKYVSFLAVENVHGILVGKLTGKDHMGNLIKWMIRELNCEGVDWIDLTQDSPQNRAVVKSIMHLRSTHIAANS